MKAYINLNENVKVKILDEGYAHMAKQHNALMSSLSKTPSRTAEYYKNKADDEGYTKMQWHNFISTFGSVTGIGFFQYYDITLLMETPF